MKTKPPVLQRKKPVKIISWAIIAAIVLIMFFFGRNSFLKVIMKHNEAAKLERKVELLQAENERLRQENADLKTNPDTIEKIAREKLGYQKSNEKVFRFLNSEEEGTDSKKDK